MALDRYNDVDLIDVRVFCAYVLGEGPKPTKRGISMAVTKLPQLIEALSDARAEAERRGLLEARE